MSVTKRRMTPEEREARLERERELVEESVERLRSSEGWQQWLETRSRFHRYSLGNQLLVAIQCPDAVRVAGFKKWLELGYCVKKGERAIKIYAPVPPSKKMIDEAKENGDDAPRTFFRLVPVFADSQVEALPPPAEPQPISPPIVPLEGDDLEDAWFPLTALAESIGFTVEVEDTGRAGGYMNPEIKKIGISEGSSINGRVRTLGHELGHALVRVDRQEDDPKLSYAEEEIVVESVAMSVMGTMGFDTSQCSIPYLASWAEKADIKILEATAKMINRICERIESVLPEES